jgi:hypothetical protein
VEERINSAPYGYLTLSSCILNTCVTWQDIDYKLPEDDTIVSKRVGV